MGWLVRPVLLPCPARPCSRFLVTCRFQSCGETHCPCNFDLSSFSPLPSFWLVPCKPASAVVSRPFLQDCRTGVACLEPETPCAGCMLVGPVIIIVTIRGGGGGDGDDHHHHHHHHHPHHHRHHRHYKTRCSAVAPFLGACAWIVTSPCHMPAIANSRGALQAHEHYCVTARDTCAAWQPGRHDHKHRPGPPACPTPRPLIRMSCTWRCMSMNDNAYQSTLDWR